MDELNTIYFLASLILFILILNDLINYYSYHKNKTKFGNKLKVYQNKNKSLVLLFNLILALIFIIYVNKRINVFGFNILCIPAFVIIFMVIVDVIIKMRRKWIIYENGITFDGILLKWKEINILKWGDNELTFIFKNKLFGIEYNEKVSLIPVKNNKTSIFSMLKKSKI